MKDVKIEPIDENMNAKPSGFRLPRNTGVCRLNGLPQIGAGQVKEKLKILVCGLITRTTRLSCRWTIIIIINNISPSKAKMGTINK